MAWWFGGYYVLLYYIFSKGGFTEGLKAVADRGEVKLISLDDMYRCRRWLTCGLCLYAIYNMEVKNPEFQENFGFEGRYVYINRSNTFIKPNLYWACKWCFLVIQ